MSSEILNTWRQLIRIKKQQTRQWGGEQFPVTLYQIDKVVKHYNTAIRQRDEAVELLNKYNSMCMCMGLGAFKQDVQKFLDELSEVSDVKK